jgi:two-component system, cell cycle sensor histidine kinase and response regulator CckA
MPKRVSTNDFSGRNDAREALRAWDGPDRLLFENNPQPMWIYDVESLAFLAVNLAAVDLYGYSRNEFLRMTIQDIRPAQDIPGLLDIVGQQVEGFLKSSKCKHLKKDGTLIDVEITSHDLLWSGRPARLVSAADITERTRTEERLTQSEESYRQLVEESPDAMLVHRHGAIIFANGACARLFGASTADQLLGRQHLDSVHPNDRELVKERIQKFAYDLESVRRYETQFLRFDGTEIYAEVVARSVIYKGEPAVQVMLRDISQRLQAEQTLRRREADLAAAQRIAHLGSYEMDVSDLDGFEKNPIRWSDENFRIFGYEPGQIAVFGTTFLSALHPEDKVRIREELRRGIRDGNSVSLEYRIIRPNGAVRFIHSHTNVIRDAKTNHLVRLVGTAQDITESKKAEERFYKAFNANPEPMTIAIMSNGLYIDVNESFLRITEHRREDVIGHTSLDLHFWERPEDRAKFIEILTNRGSVRDLEITFLTKSGEQRIGMILAETIEVDGQTCVLAIVKDFTDQKGLEKQLRQSQKMEAIGQLSGGIAHDFNNLLSVIIGYCEAIEERLSPDDPLQRKCEQIKKAGQSAASLTSQLLAFSRQQVLAPKILDLNTIVRNVEKMLRRLIGEHIDFSTVLEPGLASIKADQGQIEQVIVNLVVNARDAMPRGGRLRIETASVHLDEAYVRRHSPQQAGPYVSVTVSDTGTGMDAETQAHIFEPFFTTKEIGKGTGLGLSTVYGVVRQSDGHIWVYSELGHGTTFKIYLPRSGQAAQVEKSSPGLTESLRGTETILLVEDAEPLRELARGLLADNGYTVLETGHPEHAIEIARKFKGSIHLLLTDMVMPGMNGRVLAGKLASVRPDMKVVFMSGYTGFTHSGLVDSELILLPKPFTKDTLLRKVRDVLALKAELNEK